MPAIFPLMILLLGVASSANQDQLLLNSSQETIISARGKVDFSLYSCCYSDKESGEICTTCEDVYLKLDKQLIYDKKPYSKLKLTISNSEHNLYGLGDKKVTIKGKVTGFLDDVLNIELTELSE